jgi:pSer/pThr/pTyr-binding forkhead associated (FHA) protein
MFYEKKITERIDIFSAGVAFARLFTGVEFKEDPGLEVKLSAEEEKEFNTLFKKKHLQRLPNKKVRETFKKNFKIFNFYRSYLQKELQNPGLNNALQKIYLLFLNMMNVNPRARPDANTLILQVQDILEKSSIKLETPGNGFVSPVFKIRKTPVTIVNLNKKPTIEIGSIKRKEQADDGGFNDINLRFIDISRQHLQVNYIESPTGSSEDKIEILDLHSKHGVFLNNEKIGPGIPRELNPGDIIQLGSIISFRFTRGQGFCIMKNITRERKRGNLLWMDKDQVKELPDKEAVIILLKKPLYLSLSSFGVGDDTALMVDEEGDLEMKGGPEYTRVNGDIIL